METTSPRDAATRLLLSFSSFDASRVGVATQSSTHRLSRSSTPKWTASSVSTVPSRTLRSRTLRARNL